MRQAKRLAQSVWTFLAFMAGVKVSPPKKAKIQSLPATWQESLNQLAEL
jgi:hypothetical protein